MRSARSELGAGAAELAACKTLASALVQPDGWARGEREGYGGPRDVTSLSLSARGPCDVTSLSLSLSAKNS